MVTIKNFIIIILTLTAFFCYGQETTKGTQTEEFKKFQFGINFSPDFAYRVLKNNDGTSDKDFIIDVRNKTETIKLGYTAGVNVFFNIKKTIGLETGIQYSNKGYQIKKKDLIFT
jgi:hypothetical protein